jgi:hypothetical protein
MRRLTLLAALLGVLATPALAHAAACSSDPNRSPDTWFVRDEVTHQDLTDAQIAQPLPLLHSYEVSLNPGASSGYSSNNDLLLNAPAGVPISRDGHSLIVAPTAAGPLPISASWTETNGVDPACSRASVLNLNVGALSQTPAVRVSKFVASDRPFVSFTVTVSRGAFGIADPISLKARATKRASAPRRGARTLFTLPLGLPAFGSKPPRSGLSAHHRKKLAGITVAAFSAVDPDNFEQIPVPAGGSSAQATFSFDGTGRKVRNKFGSFYRNGVLSRRGLLMQVVQDGKLIGQLRTGIKCVNVPNHGAPHCRLPGYKVTR